MLLGLRKLRSLGARRAILKIDSQLVALQVEKSYQAHGVEMKKYLDTIRSYEKRFRGFSVQHIPRVENSEADELAKMVAQGLHKPSEVFFEVLTQSAIDHKSEVLAIHRVDWREEIEAYLRRESNPEEGSEEEKRLQWRARTYLIIDDRLYKAGVCGPFLRCIAPDEVR